MTQLTEKEQIVLERFEKYLFENGCNSDIAVSMLKLIFAYSNAGSASHLAKQSNITPQYINRICESVTINGIRIYFNKI